MNTYTRGEVDNSMLKDGYINVSRYRHQHKVAGQVEPVEYAMRPQAAGFHKRFSLRVREDQPPCDSSQSREASKNLICGIAEWQLTHTICVSTPMGFNEHAMTMFDVVKGAIAEFKGMLLCRLEN